MRPAREVRAGAGPARPAEGENILNKGPISGASVACAGARWPEAGGAGARCGAGGDRLRRRGTEPGSGSGDGKGKDSTAAQNKQSEAVSIAPKDGAKSVETSGALKVNAAKGRLTQVVVKDPDGEKVEGKMSGDGVTWTPSTHLAASTKYTVHAVAEDAEGRFHAPRHHETPSRALQLTRCLSPPGPLGGAVYGAAPLNLSCRGGPSVAAQRTVAAGRTGRRRPRNADGICRRTVAERGRTQGACSPGTTPEDPVDGHDGGMTGLEGTEQPRGDGRVTASRWSPTAEDEHAPKALESFGNPAEAEVLLPSRPESAATARRLTQVVVLRHWGLGARITEDAVLLVSELVGNAVRHTGARVFGLRLRRRRGWIRVEVRGQVGVPGGRPARSGTGSATDGSPAVQRTPRTPMGLST
ncbi:hypothetical protein SALBM311S_11294 [Streptomyces alboniger]